MNYIYSILSSIMFAFYPFFMKQLMVKGVHVNTLNFYYAFISLVAFFIISVVKNKSFKQFKIGKVDAFLTIFSVGFVGCFLTNLSISLALKYIDMSLVTFVKSSYPIIILLIQMLFFSYKITKKDVIDVCLIIVGLLLVLGKVTPQEALVLGVTIAFISAVSIAYYSLMLSKIPTKLDDFTFWFYCYVGSTIPFFISYLLSSETGLVSFMFNNFSLFFYTILSALVGYTFSSFLYGVGIKKIGVVKAGILGILAIVFTVLLDIIVYETPINTFQYLGIILIILSSFTDLIVKKS